MLSKFQVLSVAIALIYAVDEDYQLGVLAFIVSHSEYGGTCRTSRLLAQ